MQVHPMHRLGALALACSLALSITNALGEDYYWAVSGNATYGPGKTPTQACTNFANYLTTRGSAYAWTSYYSSRDISTKGTVSWYCRIEFLNRAMSSTWATVKRGTSCAAGATYNEISGECELETTIVERKSSGQISNLSCDSGSRDYSDSTHVNDFGNHLYETAIIEKASPSSIGLSIYYNRLKNTWDTNFSYKLLITSKQIMIASPRGREVVFYRSGNITTPEPGEFGSLTKSQLGWTYSDSLGSKFDFDESGGLTKIYNPKGSAYSVQASENSLNITNNLNETMAITLDGSVRFLPLRADTNKTTAIFNYTNGRLTSISKNHDGESNTKSFHYEDTISPERLTGVTTEDGIRQLYIKYDTTGRVVSTENASGTRKKIFAYNSDGSTTQIDQYGKKVIRHYQVIQGIQRVVSSESEASDNCPASNSSFTYDAQGLMKTKTDAKGNLTTYDYNDRGLETSRSEASGTPQARTVTTEWHPTLFLKTKVTEPDRITTYQYDAQGRQTGQIVTPR